MGQKIRPDVLRLGITKPWKSRWFFKDGYRVLLEEDMVIRDMVNKKISQGGIVSIDIERTAGECRVNIKAARPGLIIGPGPQSIIHLPNTT